MLRASSDEKEFVGRRKRTVLDDLMVLPWWYSPLAAIIAYICIGYILPSVFPHDKPVTAAVVAAMLQIAPLAALALLIPMPFAYLNGRKKKQLIDTNRDLEIIRDLSWQEFEQIVAEAYRRKGYSVRENVVGGPDGGIDLSLEKDGQLHLVQCKHWRTQKVGVKVAREMYGIMVDQGAASAIVVTAGMFSQEARNFAESNPIDLIDGPQLVALIAGVQVGASEMAAPVQSQASVVSPSCPECGGEMVVRTAQRGQNAGKQFMGCSGFPKCRYTQDA